MASIGSASSGSNITGQLDVQYIVEQIITAKKQPIKDLQVFETFYEAKRKAFQDLNTKVSALESAIYDLNKTGFSSKSVDLSTDTYFSATASASADSGEYYVTVKQMAAAHSISSTANTITDANNLAFEDLKLTFRDNNNNVVGTVDYSGVGTFASMNMIRDKINGLGLDISATVVNYGSSSSPKYRLHVAADETGSENGFTITESTTGTSLGLTTSVAARDSQIYVNVDPNTNPNDYISRSSNTISDVINGVTLKLKTTGSAPLTLSQATTITVSQSSEDIKEKITNFVEKFNDIMTYLNQQFTYDEQNERAGVLSGESAARKVKEDLLSMAVSSLEGYNSEYKNFAMIGLEMTRTGTIEIDETKLDNALAEELDSVTRIFKNGATSSNSEVRYVGSDDNTQSGNYAVYVTRAAEQAMAQGLDALDTLGQDENLTVTYGGKSYNIALSEAMTASQVVSAINDEFTSESAPLYARVTGGKLQILTSAYGSTQSVQVSSDTAHDAVDGSTGIGTTPVSDTGVDVAGTINGKTATGNGRILSSDTGDSKGLILQLSTTSVTAPGESKGTVSYSRGVGEQIRKRMFELSFPYTGLLAKNIDSFDDKLQNIADKISSINRQLAQEQELLIDQFSRANEALAQMSYMQSTIANNFK